MKKFKHIFTLLILTMLLVACGNEKEEVSSSSAKGAEVEKKS